ncbi:hypothetical protein [Mycetohabitans rhizoxinica]|uniref:hypothetical protein n=1 Tax=Mycetohabitans rhizoxinica TaxID=412963 RepID=UPI0030CB293B
MRGHAAGITDIQVRKQWDDYQRAYEERLAVTSVDPARWYSVPADSKTHRNLIVAELLRRLLLGLDLRYFLTKKASRNVIDVESSVQAVARRRLPRSFVNKETTNHAASHYRQPERYTFRHEERLLRLVRRTERRHRLRARNQVLAG